MHNKILVREAVELCNERWRERFKSLHSPEHEKISLNKEIKKKLKLRQRKVKINYERCMNLHHINKNAASIELMR